MDIILVRVCEAKSCGRPIQCHREKITHSCDYCHGCVIEVTKENSIPFGLCQKCKAQKAIKSVRY